MASTSGPHQIPVEMVLFHGSQKIFIYIIFDFRNSYKRDESGIKISTPESKKLRYGEIK